MIGFPPELIERCAKEVARIEIPDAWPFEPEEVHRRIAVAVLDACGYRELIAALENIAVYGCGMLSQPASLNGDTASWLRLRIGEYENVARAALLKASGKGDGK